MTFTLTDAQIGGFSLRADTLAGQIGRTNNPDEQLARHELRRLCRYARLNNQIAHSTAVNALGFNVSSYECGNYQAKNWEIANYIQWLKGQIRLAAALGRTPLINLTP